MKVISALSLLLLLWGNQSFANQCFELSQDGKTWEPNPFTLCVEENTGGTSEYKLALSKEKKNIAVYFLNALPGAADARVFGVNPMSGSIVDDSVTISIGYGEVMIGSGKYFYKE
jgi:hypothetical protein